MNFTNIKYSFVLLASFCVLKSTQAQSNLSQNISEIESLFHSAFQDYANITNDYIANQKETIQIIRDWRKKTLSQQFLLRLDEIEKNLNTSNKVLIEQFESFIKENGSSSLDDILLIRLAQLHFEKANLDFNSKMKIYQQDLDLYTKGIRKEAPSQPVPDYKRTIQIAQFFEKSFPSSPLIDKALYLVGFSAEEMGLTRISLNYYKKLADNYKESEFRDEVLWRLADYYFSNQNYFESEKYYSQLVLVPSSYTYKSLYKLGAVYFSQKNFIKSVQNFENLIGSLQSIDEKSSEEELLLNESYDYLAAILSHDQSITIQSNYLEEVFYRLGMLYSKRLDSNSMRSVFINAISLFPNSKWLPNMYSQIIQSYEEINNQERVNFFRNKFVESLTKTNRWWNLNEAFKEIYFTAQDSLEFNLLKSAQYYANHGYKNKNTNSLDIARGRYLEFVKNYPWSNYAERAQLELADIEYYFSRYAISSNYYFELVQKAKSASIREEAAYSLILSESKKTKYNLTFSESFVLTKNNKSEMSISEKTFIQASEYYLSQIPKSARRSKILYKLAEVYASKGLLDKSIPYLNQLISYQSGQDEYSLKGFQLLLDIYNVRNDWVSYRVIMELLSSLSLNPSIEFLDKDSLLEKFKELIEPGINAELQSEYDKAVKIFETFIQENIKNPIVPILQLKLTKLYYQTQDMNKLLDTVQKLERSQFSAEAIFLKAQMLFRQTLFDESLALYQKFMKENPKHPWFESALLNSASLRMQMRQHTQVVQLLNNFSSKSSLFASLYLQALIDSNKYDEVIARANALSKQSGLDKSMLLQKMLISYYEKDDFINLKRACPTQRSLSDSTTAYLTYIYGFCDFVDLRVLVTQPNTSLNEIQTALNGIAKYKIDELVVQSVNVILELSNLAIQEPEKVKGFVDRAWEIAKQSPYSKESQEFIKLARKVTSKELLHLGYFINWSFLNTDLFKFHNLESREWAQLQPLCLNLNSECALGLKKIIEQQKNELAYENLILYYLNKSEDTKALDILAEYSKNLDWPQRAIDLHYVLGVSDKIPKDKIKFEGQLSYPVGILAVIERNIESRNFKDALKFIRMNLGVHPDYSQTYIRAAKLYYERGYPELAITVLNNAYTLNQSPLVESVLYQLSAAYYSKSNIESTNSSQNLYVNYAYGLASLKSRSSLKLEAYLNQMQDRENLKSQLKAAQEFYKNNFNYQDVNLNTSLHGQWIQSLMQYSLNPSSTRDSFKNLGNQGFKHPHLKEFSEDLRSPSGESL